MKVANWLAAAAAAHPDRAAAASGGEGLDYRELERRASSVARRLHGMGIARGDRVVSLLPAGVDVVAMVHATMKLGAAFVPIDPSMGEAARDALLGRIEPALVVAEPAQIEEAPDDPAAELLEMIDLDDVACVICTSGSSGQPKAVELTYTNQLWSAVGCGMRIGMRAQDRWLCCLPLYHIGGLSILVRSVIYGSAAIVERFEAATTAELFAKQDVTIVSLVATMLERLLDCDADFGALRCALLGGGPMPDLLARRALEAGVPVAPTYGLTEACSQVTTLLPKEVTLKPGSAGPPLSPTRIRIGEDGRILVNGPTVAPAEVGDDGWLRTGDVGRIDGDGYLYVLGRADQVIITGGENVAPEEVERALLEHPAVADVAVFGRDDPQWQSAVVAAIVTRRGEKLDAEQLHTFCRERLAGYKVPKQFETVSELPRNAQGKLMRAELG